MFLPVLLTVISHSGTLDATLTVQLGGAPAEMLPVLAPGRLFGSFFEDFLHAADGGAYAEKLANRALALPLADGADGPGAEGWHAGAGGGVWRDASAPLNDAVRNALWLSPPTLGAAGGGGASAYNTGFLGAIAVQAGEELSLSLWVYVRGGGLISLNATLLAVGADTGAAAVVASAVLLTDESAQPQWRRINATMVAGAGGCSQCRLQLHASGAAGAAPAAAAAAPSVGVTVVSLFPAATFRDRPNGLRRDVAGWLNESRPAVLRGPGGCYVEGRNISNGWFWKQTLGPIETRPGHNNDVWGYWTDDGLGMLELLMMAEDVGATPLLVVNAGCGTVHGPSYCVGDGAELDSYVQDALDAVEYAAGASDTPWGARRAAGGHAAPFELQAFAIGNENCGGSTATQYAANFLRIATAVRAAHPALRLVLGCETQEQMLAVTKAQPAVLALADMYDVHQRKDPAQMLAAAHEFDAYPRQGAPKLFVSEYSSPRSLYPNSTTLAAALAEAVYMAGMEANADVVELATYGDLMANAADDHGSAGVSTISINAAGSFGSPSWVVQKLFMAAQPHALVPSTLAVAGQPVIAWKNGGTCNAGSSGGGGGGGGEVGGKYDDDGDVGATMLAASVSLAADGAVQAKLINYGGQPANVTVQLELSERQAMAAPMTAELSFVTGESTDVNSFAAPRHVAIEHRSGVPILDGGRVELTLPSWSGSVLVVRGVDTKTSL